MHSMTHLVARDIAMAAADLGHARRDQNAGPMIVGLVSLLCVCILTAILGAASIPKAMAVDEEVKICPTVVPCGWAIYDTRLEKRHDPVFAPNLCDCPTDTVCFPPNEPIPKQSKAYYCKPVALSSITTGGNAPKPAWDSLKDAAPKQN